MTMFDLNTIRVNYDKQDSLNQIIERYSTFNNSERETKELSASIIDYLKKKEVVIYGAGTAGVHFLEVLKQIGILPTCYIDRNADKISEVRGVPVYDPSRIKSLKNDNWTVIVAVNEIETANKIITYLQDLNLGVHIFNGLDLIRILLYPVCFQNHSNNEGFDILQCARCGIDVKKCQLFTEIIKLESKFDSSILTGSKKFDWVGYILGQVCTLKCECCCESIPFISNAGFVNASDVISDIEKLTDACEYLERLEFIGGEPFLHSELAQILEAALSMKRVGYLYVFTNGSIVPTDELCQILKNPRIMIHISNYNEEWPDKLPNNIANVKRKFDEQGIRYIFLENSSWLDISQFEANGLSDEVLEIEFAKCFINHCHRLFNGILYRCPHQFAGIQMNKIQHVAGQSINIHTLNSDELAEALEDFENLKFLDSCRHCSMPVGPLHVPAGKQVVISKTVIDEQKQ